MVKIIQKEEKILRKKALPVPLKDISSQKIQKIITDMKKAMSGEDDAVAIAAPQIGVSLRIFSVSGKAFLTPGELSQKELPKNLPPDLVFINPEIIKQSKKEQWAHEGCLSVRWLYGDIKRRDKVTIRAYNESGEQFTRGASGLLAQIFQHEIEHLDGKLFTDKARNIEEMLPKKVNTKKEM